MIASEEKLLEGLRRGSNAAYTILLRRYGSILLGYASRLLGSRDNAEEVVQEAIVSIIGHIHRFEGRCSLRSWLFRIVHHKAVDYLRRNARYVSLPEHHDPMEGKFNKRGGWAQPVHVWENSPEAQVDARQMLEIVQSKMNELPHNYRQMLLLREVYQMDTSEICEVLEISPVHARVMLHRARQALYKAVDSYRQQRNDAS